MSYDLGTEEQADRDSVRRAVEFAKEHADPTAQDVIDALRLASMSQDDDAEIAKLLDALLDFAPETDSNRGVDLLLKLIAEGSLKVALK